MKSKNSKNKASNIPFYQKIEQKVYCEEQELKKQGILDLFQTVILTILMSLKMRYKGAVILNMD